MNATDIALFLRLPNLVRRQSLPAEGVAAPGDAGTDPGGPVEVASVPPTRPGAGLPPHVVNHVLHLIDELTGLAYQAGQFGHLATQAGTQDPCARSQHQDNQANARALQTTYYAEIRNHLTGGKS